MTDETHVQIYRSRPRAAASLHVLADAFSAPAELQSCLMSLATAVTAGSSSLELPVVCDQIVHPELETDTLTGPNIPGYSLVLTRTCHHLILTCSTPGEPA